jgi:hypothetical protein
MYKSVPRKELIALYALANVCLISSTHDSINLACYEYLVCRRENHSMLVISECAGAEALSGGALVENPLDTDEFSSIIYQASSMGQQERKEKHEASIRSSSVCSNAPVAGSQRLTVLSTDADATSLPSGENVTAGIEREWPLSVCSNTPLAAPQRQTPCLSCHLLTLPAYRLARMLQR